MNGCYEWVLWMGVMNGLRNESSRSNQREVMRNVDCEAEVNGEEERKRKRKREGGREKEKTGRERNKENKGVDGIDDKDTHKHTTWSKLRTPCPGATASILIQPGLCPLLAVCKGATQRSFIQPWKTYSN